MRFWSRRDYETALSINKELINTVIDTVVVIYKVHVESTKTNIYDESTSRKYYTGVRVPARISREPTVMSAEGVVLSSTQRLEVAFLRNELQERSIYPEPGDIIDYHDSYYEITNINEVQLVAGQVHYNHTILCNATLTTITSTMLERPIL